MKLRISSMAGGQKGATERESGLLRNDRALRTEADTLLEQRGLRALLETHAPIHVVGSYALELMVWRDLDLILDAPGISLEEFFDIGRKITLALAPWKMFFTDNRDHAGGRYPRGLYWGIRLGDIAQGAWKIDLWAFEPEETRSKVDDCRRLRHRLNHLNRLRILDLKSQLWRDPRYRDEITSQDIYDAVLDHRASSVADVWAYVQRRQAQESMHRGTQ
jgi:hypothetical protein